MSAPPSPPEPPKLPEMPELPERIGPYRVEGRLGAGGMGEVLRGWDERLQRPVAIKRVLHGRGSPQQRERFRREARAAARLSHPAIVQVHELVVGEDCDPPEPWDALVLELVEGRTLAELGGAGQGRAGQGRAGQERAGLPVAAVLDLTRQVAEGLAEAHAQGLVHRDLKAENVMVSPGSAGSTGGPARWDRARILDFGLAKALEPADGDTSLTVEGALLGTSRAMAPEQAEGREVDGRADLFSLGVLLYELLAGRSPFRAPTAVQTLKRVLTEEPPRLDVRRPELAASLPGLADLVQRLLAKDRERRPATAGKVAAELAALAARPGVEDLGPPPLDTSDAAPVEPGLSEAPTAESPSPALPGAAVFPTGPPAGSVPGSPTEPPRQPATERADRPSGRRLRGRVLGVLGALGVLAIVVGLALWFLAPGLFPPWFSAPWPFAPWPEPRTVAVLEPSVAGEPSPGEAPGAAVLLAVLDGLASLEGVEPLDPSLIANSGARADDPLAVARALAADEVLQTSIECRDGGWCRVAFRRLAGESGQVLEAAAPFEVSAQPEDALELAGAVRAHLQRDVYPRHPPREGPGLDVRPQDYEVFLDLRRRADAGESLGEGGLQALASLLETSPRFADAYLWAADQARVLGRTERALGWLDRAAELLPGDPRPWARRVQVLLEAERPAEAETALESLEEMAPGSIRAAAARARWAEARDRPQEAVAAWQRVVDRRPSWRNLWRLARAELSAGRPADARRHLEELLQRSPDNASGLEQLAFLEGRSGDLARAESLYRRLTETAPHRRHWSNLAWIQYLRGRYGESERSGGRALELEPGHVPTRINLALAEAATGDEEAPRRRCREVLADLPPREGENGPGLAPWMRMIRAQCLAWLDDHPRALRDVESVLQEAGGNPQLRFQAAVVFTLLGDRRSALYQARRAMEAGLRREWFAVPLFAELREDLQEIPDVEGS